MRRTIGWLACVLIMGCTSSVDRTEPTQVGRISQPTFVNESSMARTGEFRGLIASGFVPTRDRVIAQEFLEDRALPDARACADALCASAWFDAERELVAVRLTARAPEDLRSPEHITVMFASDSSAGLIAEGALLDAIRDAPTSQRFSLVTAGARPSVLARASGDQDSRRALTSAARNITRQPVDLLASLAFALDESARNAREGAARRVILLLSSWPSRGADMEGRLLSLIEGEVGDDVDVAVFTSGAFSPAPLARRLSAAGVAPRGHVSRALPRGWADEALSSPLGSPSRATRVELTLPAGASVEGVWGAPYTSRGSAISINVGALAWVSQQGDALRDAIVLARVRGARATQVNARVTWNTEALDVRVEGADLEELEHAAITLEGIDESLSLFGRGGPERARARALEAASRLPSGSDDASLLRGMSRVFEAF